MCEVSKNYQSFFVEERLCPAWDILARRSRGIATIVAACKQGISSPNTWDAETRSFVGCAAPLNQPDTILNAKIAKRRGKGRKAKDTV